MEPGTRRRITAEELAELTADINRAERSGELEGMFGGEIPHTDLYPCKKQLLQSIGPAMKLTRGFFKRVYGYDLTSPGFSDQVIDVLERDGCSHAKQYYDMVVNEVRQQSDAEWKSASAWYVKECDKMWASRRKGGEEERNRRREQLWKKGQLLRRKRALLLQRLQQLNNSLQA